jgi:dinuclear metal center YbgI/SA1388 family protein
MNRDELESYLNQFLNTSEYNDYGPNGLQIEGKKDISKVAFAVSATKKSIEQAIAQKADTLIVHHGLFWKFHGVRTLTGPFANRVLPLVKNEMNLFGYHLPLDAHPEVGNAAGIAKALELEHLQSFGDHKGMPTGLKGTLPCPLKPFEIQEKLETVLDHKVLVATPNSLEKISSLGIITGGANGDWIHCLRQSVDGYITGEMSEHDWHESQEAGIHMFAGGHNATERFGTQQLMAHLQEKFTLDCFFIDSENPA